VSIAFLASFLWIFVNEMNEISFNVGGARLAALASAAPSTPKSGEDGERRGGYAGDSFSSFHFLFGLLPCQ